MNEIFIFFMVMLGIVGLVWYFSKTGVISEDTKYLIFDKDDKDRMDPKEFEKAMRINKEHEELRTAVLAKKHAKKQDKDA